MQPFLGLLRPGASLITSHGARRLPSTASLHILAYLVLEKRPFSRRRLASLFWPDAAVERGLHSLSQQIYQLRRVLPEGVLVPTPQALAVDGEALTADVRILLRAQSDDTAVDVSELYQCDFLHDATFASDDLVAWCEAWRSRTRVAAVDLLAREARRAYAMSDWNAVLHVTAKQLEIAPLDDACAAQRAQALSSLGHFSAAADFLHSFRKRFVAAIELQPTLPQPGELVSSNAADPKGGSTAVPFVGRQSELLLLQRLADRATSGNLQSALISGVPGSGKSRLGIQLLRWAALKGTNCVYASARFSERLLPYGLVRHLYELLGGPVHTPLTGSGAVDSLTELITQRAGDRTLAICLDDVQWADASSCDALGILADRLRLEKVLILLLTRSGEAQSTKQSWGWVSDNLHLSGLSASDVEILVKTLGDSDYTLTAQQKEWVTEGLAGNPFYIIETLKYLHSATTAGDHIPVPPTIRRVLRSQIGRLHKHSRRLLSCAAVYGTHASTSEVFAAARLPTWQLMAAVEELTSAELIEFTNEQISIRHDLIREAIYGDTPPHVRQTIHAKAARAITNASPERASEIVRHQYLAKDYSRAFETALAASHAATSIAAFGEAECFLHLALRTATSPYQQTASHRALMEFLCDQRRYVEAVRPARALRKSGCDDPGVRLAGTIGKCASELQRAARPISEIGERVERAANAAKEARHIPRLRDAVVLLAELAQHEGRVARVQRWSDQFLAMAGEDVNYSVEISGLAATLAALAGDPRAGALSATAVKAAEAANNTRLIAVARSYSASAHMLRGDILAASRDYELAVVAAERAGMRDVLFFTEGNRAVAYIERGEFGEALALLQRCLRYGRRVHAFQYANLAILGIESRDWELAARSARTLLDMYGRYRVPWIPVVAHTCLGLVALEANDVAQAATHAATVEGHLHSTEGALSDRSYAEIFLARFRVCQGGSHAALAALLSAERGLRLSQPLASLRLRLEIATIRCSTGDGDRALLATIANDAESRGALLIASRARASLSL